MSSGTEGRGVACGWGSTGRTAVGEPGALIQGSSPTRHNGEALRVFGGETVVVIIRQS
jgi:hypothetical protein